MGGCVVEVVIHGGDDLVELGLLGVGEVFCVNGLYDC